MSDQCVECGRTVDPAECSASWDDGQPIYTCADCCTAAELDNFWQEEARKADERDNRIIELEAEVKRLRGENDDLTARLEVKSHTREQA